MSPEKKNHNRELLQPRVNKFDHIIRLVEEIVFTLIIITMIVIGLAPVVSRYAGMPGVAWTESLSQHMVLWIAFLGAGTAIRERMSISIDAAPHLFTVRKRLFLRGLTECLSAVVCGVLAWVSISFVQDTFEFEKNTIAFLNIREWWLTAVLPCGFFLLTLRLLIASFEDIFNTFRMNFDEPDADPEREEV